MHVTEMLYRHPKALTTLNVFIVGAILVSSLFFVRSVLSLRSQKTVGPASPVQQPPVMSMKKGFESYAAILRNNPFGFPAGELRQISLTQEKAASPADMKLIGTVSGHARYSYAIFADKSGRQEVFRIGEPVFGAGKLKRIHKDTVVISESGRESTIPLSDLLSIREQSPPSATPAASSGFVQSTGSSSYLVDQKSIHHALDNPNQIMTDARLQPNIVSGRQEGFRLREVRTGGIYHSLGLRNDDVLLRVNDYNISEPQSALNAFTALKGLDRVQLDIVRSGSRMTMTYQIR